METTIEGTDPVVEAIRSSGLSIYDPLAPDHAHLRIPTDRLETVLDRALTGLSLRGLPLRTRSKVVKEHVCRALGYPVPPSFTKTQPRFPGQCLDVYTQKADNLQIWNSELEPDRRYALVRLGPDDDVLTVRVVTGDTLSPFDTTGVLTRKYQARLIERSPFPELVSPTDTDRLIPWLQADFDLASAGEPTTAPRPGQLLPIGEIFNRLKPLLRQRIADAGHDQERNRGAALHRLVCNRLGYSSYRDDGQFPDVPHQLLEVKLQTSPTIDLGRVKPDSPDELPTMPRINDAAIRHCDVRYAVFSGFKDRNSVVLTHFYATTGRDFFSRFPQFQGKTVNTKLQFHLPPTFFTRS